MDWMQNFQRNNFFWQKSKNFVKTLNQNALKELNWIRILNLMWNLLNDSFHSIQM